MAKKKEDYFKNVDRLEVELEALRQVVDAEQTPLEEIEEEAVVVEKVVEEVKPETETKEETPVVEHRVEKLYYYPTMKDGSHRHHVVMVNPETRVAYHVPKNRMVLVHGTLQDIVIDEEVEMLYNWGNEIDAMIPSIEEIKFNVFLSFIRAGAFNQDALTDPQVSKNLYRTAFPYRME